MGFNKRFVDKQTIISALVEGGSSSLVKVLNADALICDEWASIFLEDYSSNTKDFLKARTKLNDDVKFLSNHKATYEHTNWGLIESPACLLVMLYTDESWTEVLKAIEMFKPKLEQADTGKFGRLKHKAIQALIQHFDSKVRTQNLEKLI